MHKYQQLPVDGFFKTVDDFLCQTIQIKQIAEFEKIGNGFFFLNLAMFTTNKNCKQAEQYEKLHDIFFQTFPAKF